MFSFGISDGRIKSLFEFKWLMSSTYDELFKRI